MSEPKPLMEIRYELSSWKDVWEEVTKGKTSGNPMVWGEVMEMTEECIDRTPPIPYTYRKIMGIPTPVYIGIFMVASFFLPLMGLPISMLAIVLVIGMFGIATLSAWLMEPKYNRQGKCCLCPATAHTSHQGPTFALGGLNRTQKKLLSYGGLCPQHLIGSYKYWLWTRAEALLKQKIVANPSAPAGPIMKAMFTIGIVKQRFSDPRSIIAYDYTSKDWKSPGDIHDENILDTIDRKCEEIINSTKRLRSRRRRTR